MTAEEYAQLGADIHAAIVARISAVVRAEGLTHKATVLDRDPVNLNDEQAWLSATLSPDDLDEEGDKRVHAWVVTFEGSVDPRSSTVRSIEPVFVYPVQVYYQHDFGTAADNSQKRIRAEVLKVQWALAEVVNFGHMAGVRHHRHLSIRTPLKRFGGRVVHHGKDALDVELQPVVAYTG